MRPRATAQLAQLSDVMFLNEVARGLGLIAAWVGDLERWATRLQEDEPAAAEVLRVTADEEAGKFLVLVDAVRCPRKLQKKRVEQLKRCHDHLAKGIYAEVCGVRPLDYKEFLGYVHDLRLSHYLDGPKDVDWIFRNQIEARREERLYVDYLETDAGQDWWTPATYDRLASNWSGVSLAVEVVRALTRAGIATPAGLQVLAEVWRPLIPQPATSYTDFQKAAQRTIERLRAASLPHEDFSQQDARRLVDAWPYPLYGADLGKVQIDLDDLRAQQRR